MNLQLIKSEHYGEVQADIYSNGNEMYMTAAQLCNCLNEPRSTFDNRISRNPHLKTDEFSVSLKMRGTDGKMYSTRIFNEDGIYEITMLSESDIGAKFRSWIRKVLKSLRSGQATLIPTAELERIKIQASQDRAKAMLLNAQNRALKTIMSTVQDKQLSPIALEVFGLTAIEQIAGKSINYRPECGKLYSATEVGGIAGVSASKIGKLANQLNLKTDEYGITVLDKSPYSAKEVSTFRYNEKGLRRLLEAVKAVN